jgi:hypothetical protein
MVINLHSMINCRSPTAGCVREDARSRTTPGTIVQSIKSSTRQIPDDPNIFELSSCRLFTVLTENSMSLSFFFSKIFQAESQ